MSDADSTPEYQVLQARGEGSEHFGAPANFYLTFRDQIEEWAALRSDAEAATDSFLEGIRQHLQQVADVHRLDMQYFHKSYRYYLRYEPSTPVVDGDPILGICLGWGPRVRVGDTSASPWVGVRAGSSPLAAEARVALLEGGGEVLRKERHLRGRNEVEWPLYWNVPGEGAWWTHLDSYRQQLVESLSKGHRNVCTPDTAVHRRSHSGSLTDKLVSKTRRRFRRGVGSLGEPAGVGSPCTEFVAYRTQRYRVPELCRYTGSTLTAP